MGRAPAKFSFLKDVKFVTKKTTVQKSPRDAFINALDKQISAVEALRDNEELPKGRKATRLWFKEDFAGNITTDLRYGSKTIALPGMTGSQTINIGTGYDKLLAFYEKVRESAHSGEFDEILIKMSQEISKRLGH